MPNNPNNEQPVSKRQRIDSQRIGQQQQQRHRSPAHNVTPVDEILNPNKNIPPDIGNDYSTDQSTDALSPIIGNGDVNHTFPHNNQEHLQYHHQRSPVIGSSDSLPYIAAEVNQRRNDPISNGNRSTDEIDNMNVPLNLASLTSSASPQLSLMSTSKSQSNINSSIASTTRANTQALLYPSEILKSNLCNLVQFQSFITNQCLCNMHERTLQRIFECRHYYDENGQRQVAVLSEWPVHQIIQYLSNIQLLTDAYLQQNTKGRICSRIMDVFNLIERDEAMIEEIFKLGGNSNTFVQFLAGRVIANCFVIAKDNQIIYEGWLSLLVAGLNVNCVSVTNINYMDFASLRRINSICEIVLRILEWRDDDQIFEESAQVEQEMAVNADGSSSSSSSAAYVDIRSDRFTLPLVVPPITNNYFATFYNDGSETGIQQHRNSQEALGTASTRAVAATSSMQRQIVDEAVPSMSTSNAESICHCQYLADSESFDTQALKSNIVTSLKSNWSRLVDRMIAVIHRVHAQNELKNTENTIITFLTLWERIISIQANLSVDSTLPFHEELSLVMKKLLIEITLPTAIYKQLLTLLNESLCYGTTLALQSSLPIENNTLANDIFNKVKNQQIFATMPVVSSMTQPARESIIYTARRRSSSHHPASNGDSSGGPSTTSASSSSISEEPKSMNRSIHQKLVLLILKSIAVTVKVLRNEDSSDSSMDGYSSTSSNDYEAFQEALQIERATRDVLKKLKRFMRISLNHHPETHFSKMLIHLFSDQDEYLIESMLCTLDITTVFLARQPHSEQTTTISATATPTASRDNLNALLAALSPVYSFLEFLRMIEYKVEFLLDLLVSSETCFLLYLLRFLKYIRKDWLTFCIRCNDWVAVSGDNGARPGYLEMSRDIEIPVLDRTMGILIELRKLIERLVLQNLFPYNITPIIQLLRQCEGLFEGNELF